MSFDLAQNGQLIYTKIKNAMSRPGKIENISLDESNKNNNIRCYEGTYLMMKVLLKGEDSFSFVGKGSAEISKTISELTNSRIKPLDEADYIFIKEGYEFCDKVIENAKTGDVTRLNKSTTIILEVKELTNGDGVELTGPGIQGISTLNLSNENQWLNIREEKIKEFPYGIDFILIDKKGNIACLPSSTEVREICRAKAV